MAVRQLSWFERHVEKVIAAGCGVVAVCAVVFCAILPPHTVKVAGEDLGADKFYTNVESSAEATRLAMKSGAPDQAGIRNPSLPDLASVAVRPSRHLIPPLVPLSPPLPEVASVDLVQGDIKLARILAPTKPFASTGRASARVPLPREVSVMPASHTEDHDSFVFTRDWHWVTLAAVISRKAQREVFEKAGYDAVALDLLVADIEAERQQRRPDGQWGSSETVKPYLSERLVGPRRLRLFKESTGYAVRQADWTYLQNYRSALSKPEAQAGILRAPFQSLLADPQSARDYRVEWTVPRTLEAPGGTKLDLTDAEYGLYFLPEDSADRVNTVQWSRLRESLGDGWRDGRLKPYLDAVAALRSIQADQEMALGHRRLAERLLNRYERDIELAEEMDQIIRKRTESAADDDRLGPDVEPIWATDTAVEPGKTYRYRVRLLAFNSYAGMTSRLADPLDAGNVIIEGEWSPWSEPVTVKPTSYLFVLGGSGEGKKTVRVRLYQWVRGVWQNGYGTFGIGDPIVIDKGLIQLTYDGVIRDIDLHRLYAEDGESGSDARPEAFSETVALTLVDSEGVTKERLAAEDWTLMNNLVRQIRDEERRQKAAAERGEVRPVATELPAYGQHSERRMPVETSSRQGSRRF